jgi:hypothetical protein
MEEDRRVDIDLVEVHSTVNTVMVQRNALFTKSLDVSQLIIQRKSRRSRIQNTANTPREIILFNASLQSIKEFKAFVKTRLLRRLIKC